MTQQGQVHWQGLSMHGWRCQESSSHSDCLFHPPWKLTWRQQCHYFPSGFLLEWVSKRCREMNPWVTTPWDAAGTSPSFQAPCAGWGSGQGKLRMSQTQFIHWMRVINMVCIQTRVGWGKKTRFHSSDSFLWKSMVTRTLALASNSSLNCEARKGLWESKAVSNQSNLSKFQSQEKNAHFHGARQTIQYKAVTGRVLMLPSIQIPHLIPVNAFQIHIKEFPKHQPTFHTPAGGQSDQHLIIKWCTHT